MTFLLTAGLAAQLSAAAPVTPPQPTIHTELTGSGGVYVLADAHFGTTDRWFFATVGVEGRFWYTPPARTVTLVLEAALYGLGYAGRSTVSPDLASGFAGTLRAGFASGNWTFTLGLNGHADFVNTRSMTDLVSGATVTTAVFPTPFPSLFLRWRPGPVGFVVGLFDRAVGPLARVGIEHRYFGLAYTILTGAEAYARLPLGNSWHLELRAFHTVFYQASYEGASLSLSWHPRLLDGGWTL